MDRKPHPEEGWVMMIAELVRYYTPKLGTIGRFVIGEFGSLAIEKDWVENTKSLSCIPEGEYECRPRWSSKNAPNYDWAYEITNVPGRTDVLIHIANWPHELEGCVALGNGLMFSAKEIGVSNSRDTIRAFHTYMNREPFMLLISQYNPHAQVLQ